MAKEHNLSYCCFGDFTDDSMFNFSYLKCSEDIDNVSDILPQFLYIFLLPSQNLKLQT